MIALRIASLIAALATIILNAHGGFTSTKVFEYAVLFAALYAALDIGKCAVLVAASRAWRQRAYLVAALCTLLFPLLFANSVWNAIQQIAITRDDTKAVRVGATQTRARTETEHARHTAELALLHASPTYAATSACALPKSKDARTFCDRVAIATTAIARLNAQLAASPPTDAEPHVTLFAAITGARPQAVQFTALLVPVLLAEVLGAVGFYIASRINAEAPGTPARKNFVLRRGTWRPNRQKPSDENSGAAGTMPSRQPSGVVQTPTAPASPNITWRLPSS
ncbi:MAG TPA: hypothetical protein PK264_01865 [Hyphomicrobiaceae bacterium]|nr:hypothetical protein [Hyphomicrobiaceae bacterium]